MKYANLTESICIGIKTLIMIRKCLTKLAYGLIERRSLFMYSVTSYFISYFITEFKKNMISMQTVCSISAFIT